VDKIVAMQEDFDVLALLDFVKANGSGSKSFADLFVAADSFDEAVETLRNARFVAKAAGRDWLADDIEAMALDCGITLEATK
jgi:hypothetical protein